MATTGLTPPPLDEKLYSLQVDVEELAFFKSETRIDDESELKKHMLAVQAKAYKVFPYPCIRHFAFTKFRISRSPVYDRVLHLYKERKGAILVDIGCNFGHDLRKVVADGWPVENAIGFDLKKDFWDYGHELFRSTPDTFPATFIPGDIFDYLMIAPRAPLFKEPDAPRPSDLKSLTSLTPLQGLVTAIHTAAFFHLFDEKQQLSIARQIATLLSPAPGSILFGCHTGLPVKGSIAHNLWGSSLTMFCHSPESWRDLWDGQVFDKGTVHVEVELEERSDFNHITGEKHYFLIWSVTRL